MATRASAIVTRSADLDHDLPVFTQTSVPPLVLTAHDPATDARARFAGLAQVYDCSGADAADVDLGAVLRTLSTLGLPRVLTEGGPSLLGAFIGAGLLDEACLTYAPMLVGGNAVRIATAEADVLTAMRPAHVLTDTDGYLYTRYVRVR